MLSVRQEGIKYHFLSLWYDSTWDWTQVSRTIGEHSNHYANVRLNDIAAWKKTDFGIKLPNKGWHTMKTACQPNKQTTLFIFILIYYLPAPKGLLHYNNRNNIYVYSFIKNKISKNNISWKNNTLN